MSDYEKVCKDIKQQVATLAAIAHSPDGYKIQEEINKTVDKLKGVITSMLWS